MFRNDQRGRETLAMENEEMLYRHKVSLGPLSEAFYGNLFLLKVLEGLISFFYAFFWITKVFFYVYSSFFVDSRFLYVYSAKLMEEFLRAQPRDKVFPFSQKRNYNVRYK